MKIKWFFVAYHSRTRFATSNSGAEALAEGMPRGDWNFNVTYRRDGAFESPWFWHSQTRNCSAGFSLHPFQIKIEITVYWVSGYPRTKFQGKRVPMYGRTHEFSFSFLNLLDFDSKSCHSSSPGHQMELRRHARIQHMCWRRKWLVAAPCAGPRIQHWCTFAKISFPRFHRYTLHANDYNNSIIH